MLAVRLFPHFFAFFLMVLLLLRSFASRQRLAAFCSGLGFAAGGIGAFLLLRGYPGKLPFEIMRSALGASFFVFWAVSVAALYRSRERRVHGEIRKAERWGAPVTALIAATAGTVAGAIPACRLTDLDGTILPVLILVAAAALLVAAAWGGEKLFPAAITASVPALLSAVVALLLFSASSVIRLDLFSPMSMKVMKGVHDFVHQFMESVLIPDHLFVRPRIWGYIGILFSKEVGFWGGMVIWFTPVLLVVLAVRLELLPSVGHIRQGAQRRKVLAAAIREKRLRLVVPMLALFFFGFAAYRSSYPVVEYWDPKPVVVTASASGDVFIPKKGDIDFQDGKLHKYLLKQGGREVRFFVLMTPEAKLTVDLDACAICKPDGYGQAEGSVICYYCKTLIPLETVGKPGGCNPVPVRFVEKEDGVHIDSITLVNTWTSTVQTTGAKKEGEK